MAEKILWISVWCTLFLCFTILHVITADDHEHIHIKLHLPEVIQKHTHLRTVVKHHFHPKKINKVRHRHQIDEALSTTDFDPTIAFPSYSPASAIKATNFLGGRHHHIPTPYSTTSWEPKTKIVDIKFRKPVSSHFHHYPSINPSASSTYNFDWENEFPKLLKSKNKFRNTNKFNSFNNHLPSHYEFANDIKFHQNFNKFEDDEDEYLMTEDTSLEHPSTLKLKDSFKSYNTLPNNFNENWMAAVAAANSMDTSNSFESLHSGSISSSSSDSDNISNDGIDNSEIWSNLSPSFDQTAYASALHNNYGFNEGQHAVTSSSISEFDRYPSPSRIPTATKSQKFRYEPGGMENFMEYYNNYNNKRPQKHNWRKTKKNKLNASGNSNNFRIHL